MSTRYMKKVYGSDVILDKDNDGASDVEISVTNDTKSKSFNVFDLVCKDKYCHYIYNFSSKYPSQCLINLYLQLNQNSDNDEQDISDKQDEEDLVTNDTNCNDMKRKKKKKKRKKSENVGKSQQHRDAECNESVDEIERSILEVNKLLGEPVAGCSNQILEPQWINKKTKEDILSVQHKHLNPYNELKRIFGSKTVQAERRYNCIYIYIIICIYNLLIHMHNL